MPSRNILVINCGSSSIKFALVNEAHSLFPLHGLAERLGSREAVLRWKRGGDSDSLADGDTISLTSSALVLENLIGKFMTNMAEGNAKPSEKTADSQP